MLRMFIGLVMLMTVIACGNDDRKANPPLIPPPEPPRDELLGRWESNCSPGQNISLTAKAKLGITERSVLEIQEKAFAEVTKITSGPCETEDIQIMAVGPLSRATTSKEDIKTFDVDTVSVRIKPVSEFGKRVLNIARWCGLGNWEIGQEQDVTRALGEDKCFSVNKLMTVYRIEDGNLFFGDTGSIASSAERSLEIVRNFRFTKQP